MLPRTGPTRRTTPCPHFGTVSYYAPDEQGTTRWRTARDVPPPERWIQSPYDRDARYSLKRGRPWVGYKVHLTETCDANTPHLITHKGNRILSVEHPE